MEFLRLPGFNVAQFELTLCYMFCFFDNKTLKSCVAWEKTSQVFVKASFPVAHQNQFVSKCNCFIDTDTLSGPPEVADIPLEKPLHLRLRSHQLMQGISHGKCHNLGMIPKHGGHLFEQILYVPLLGHFQWMAMLFLFINMFFCTLWYGALCKCWLKENIDSWS